MLVIFSISSCSSLRLGLLGPDGTFSSEAGRNYSTRNSINLEFCYYSTISDCFLALENRKVEVIIVPLVNTIIGEIKETVSGLDGQRVLGCENLEINLCLAGYSQDFIHSKKEAACQCKKRLFQIGSRVIYENSTATAAIKAKITKESAIVSARAAEIYGLPILERNIQDVKLNVTEFLILGN